MIRQPQLLASLRPADLQSSLSHEPADTGHVVAVGGEALQAVIDGAAVRSLLHAVPQHGDGALVHAFHFAVQDGHPQDGSPWHKQKASITQ